MKNYNKILKWDFICLNPDLDMNFVSLTEQCSHLDRDEIIKHYIYAHKCIKMWILFY